MKNKQIIVVAAIFITILVIFSIKKFDPNIKLPINTGKADLMSRSWDVFDQYMTYAKENNIEGVASLSHKLGPICSDPLKKEECNNLLNGVYQLGQDIKREKITEIISDRKQIILYSEYERYEDEDIIGHIRNIVYFTRDESGNPKLLSFNPADGAFFLKKNIKQDTNVDDELREMLKDSDSDTIPDQTESCSDENKLNSCTNTDPNKNDTDKDGWWDSIEVHFR